MNSELKNRAYRWGPVIIWCTTIFLFSSLPKTSVGVDYWSDFAVKKTAHIIEYGILALLSYRAFNSKRKAFIFTILYAISDEIHQSFVPGREPRARDVFFDTIGAFGGLWIIKYLPQKIQEKLTV